MIRGWSHQKRSSAPGEQNVLLKKPRFPLKLLMLKWKSLICSCRKGKAFFNQLKQSSALFAKRISG